MTSPKESAGRRGSVVSDGRTGASVPRTRLRASAALAWSLWALWLVLCAFSVWFLFRHRTNDLSGVAAAGYATVGALVAFKHPRNAVGWLMLAFALALTIEAAGEPYAALRSSPGAPVLGWLVQWVVYVWVAVILVFIPLLFPSGRVVSRRWWLGLWLGAVALALTTVGAAFKPRNAYSPVPNPVGSEAHAQLFEAAEVAGQALLGVAALVAGTSLLVRFRRADGTERQQLKWFGLAVSVIAGACLVMLVTLALPKAWSEHLGAAAWSLLVATCLVSIPAATGIAILKHRLYDIDLVINKTLVYIALTATLVVTYVGSVLLLQVVLSPLTGDSELAVAGSTLAAAALVRPARTRIQTAVDRRFYRRRYDAARTLDEFATHLPRAGPRRRQRLAVRRRRHDRPTDPCLPLDYSPMSSRAEKRCTDAPS